MKKFLLLYPLFAFLLNLDLAAQSTLKPVLIGLYSITSNDSVHWYLKDSIAYQYDSQYRTLSSYNYDSNGVLWDTLYRDVYTYDMQGNDTAYTGQTFIAAGDSFVNASRNFSQYNNTNDLVSSSVQTWDTSRGIWFSTVQDTYTYDNAHHQLSDTSQQWNNSLGRIDYVQLTTYTYDTYGNQQLKLTYTRANGTWKPVQWNSTTYRGSSDTIIVRYFALWDSASHSYLPSSLENLFYDSMDRFISELNYTWRNNTWQNQGIDSVQYDVSRKWFYHLFFTWSQNQWSQIDLDTTYLDNNGRKILWMDYQKDVSGWHLATRDEFAYDNYGNKIYWQHDFYGSLERDWWYYTYATTTGVNEVKNDLQCVVYPNPANSTLHFSGNIDESAAFEITIFDATGRRLMVQNSFVNAGTYDLALPVGKLAAGQYFLYATNKRSGKVSTIKWIRE